MPGRSRKPRNTQKRPIFESETPAAKRQNLNRPPSSGEPRNPAGLLSNLIHNPTVSLPDLPSSRDGFRIITISQ